jgi:copper homeostasis protein
MSKVLFETCVDSVESSITAELSGADRIELCAALSIGGITPSYGMIKTVLEKLKIPVNVLIRPRGGDFLFTDLECNVMKRDVLFCKEAGVNGIVTGILKEDGTIDRARTKELIDLARPMSITFHRGFDFARDAIESLNLLIELSVDRVLTSGQEADAYFGINMIKKLVEHASNRIIIMAGGGVNGQNINEIIRNSGVREIHASARETLKSKMKYKNPKMSLTDSKEINSYDFLIASEKRITAISSAIKSYNIISNV